MTEKELKAIEARCKVATGLIVAFRRLIDKIDPMPNSKLTMANTVPKMLCDWGRKTCDILEQQVLQSDKLIKAIRDRDDEIKLLKLICEDNDESPEY